MKKNKPNTAKYFKMPDGAAAWKTASKHSAEDGLVECLNRDIFNLANSFIQSKIIPFKSVEDAFHISIATIHGMDYLLTWNCKHIANASIRNLIEDKCHENGYVNPIICTPEELMGG